MNAIIIIIIPCLSLSSNQGVRTNSLIKPSLPLPKEHLCAHSFTLPQLCRWYQPHPVLVNDIYPGWWLFYQNPPFSSWYPISLAQPPHAYHHGTLGVSSMGAVETVPYPRPPYSICLGYRTASTVLVLVSNFRRQAHASHHSIALY